MKGLRILDCGFWKTARKAGLRVTEFGSGNAEVGKKEGGELEWTDLYVCRPSGPSVFLEDQRQTYNKVPLRSLRLCAEY